MEVLSLKSLVILFLRLCHHQIDRVGYVEHMCKIRGLGPIAQASLSLVLPAVL